MENIQRIFIKNVFFFTSQAYLLTSYFITCIVYILYHTLTSDKTFTLKITSAVSMVFSTAFQLYCELTRFK